MDELDKRFLDFLSDIALENSKLDDMVKKILLNYKESQFSEDEIKQDVLVEILKRKNTLMKIFETGNPTAYLWTMVLNTVRDRRRNKNTGDAQNLARYFRKRTSDSLNTSQEFRKYKVGKATSDLWYYTRATHENPRNLYIPYDQKKFPDLDMKRLGPGVWTLKTKEKILDMAGFYLDCWEDREQAPLGVKLNDFLDWILRKVDMTEVYLGNDEESRKDSSLFDDDDEGMTSDMDRFETIDQFSVLHHDRDALFRKLDQLLDDREKRCLAMTFEGMTLDDIARAEGYKGPSGAKALRDKAVVKIRLVLGRMGYTIGGAEGETFESLKPLMDILGDVLNFSGPEPSH